MTGAATDGAIWQDRTIVPTPAPAPLTTSNSPSQGSDIVNEAATVGDEITEEKATKIPLEQLSEYIRSSLEAAPSKDKEESVEWLHVNDAWLVTCVHRFGDPMGKRHVIAYEEDWEMMRATGREGFSGVMPAGFLGKRLKALGQALRTDYKALALAKEQKEAAIRAKAEAREQKLAAAAAAKAEKVREREQKAAVALKKKLDQMPKTVLAALQKIGRPREVYQALTASFTDTDSGTASFQGPLGDADALMEPLVTENKFYRSPAVLTSWQDLWKECKLESLLTKAPALGLAAAASKTEDDTIANENTENQAELGENEKRSEADEEKATEERQALMDSLKEIVDAFLGVAYTTKGEEDCLKNFPMLENCGLKPNTIAEAIEKCDAIHSLRMALACLDSQPLWDAIMANCKHAGPGVVPARRDVTLPVVEPRLRHHSHAPYRCTRVRPVEENQSGESIV